jgi:YHS domain-containing protein
MKNNPALLIIYALVANATDGAPSQMTLDPSSLNADNAGSTRVWQEQLQQQANVNSNGVILKGYDVVAYFTQHKAIKGTANSQTTYKRATYYFSSSTDLATFKEHPSKYVPQYGGYCAYHLSQNKLTDSDPVDFLIYKGKLYICSDAEGAKAFRRNIDENIRKADDYWVPLSRAQGQPFHEFGPR